MNIKLSLKDKIQNIKDLVELQGSSGNWDYDEYMHGYYNGMETILAYLENREPNFKVEPKEYLKYNKTKRSKL